VVPPKQIAPKHGALPPVVFTLARNRVEALRLAKHLYYYATREEAEDALAGVATSYRVNLHIFPVNTETELC